jgi:hypothetical protein
MKNVFETFWIGVFLLQIFGFFTPKGGGLMVQPLWDFWISKNYGYCVVHFSNRSLNFNYMLKIYFGFGFGYYYYYY